MVLVIVSKTIKPCPFSHVYHKYSSKIGTWVETFSSAQFRSSFFLQVFLSVLESLPLSNRNKFPTGKRSDLLGIVRKSETFRVGEYIPIVGFRRNFSKVRLVSSRKSISIQIPRRTLIPFRKSRVGNWFQISESQADIDSISENPFRKLIPNQWVWGGHWFHWEQSVSEIDSKSVSPRRKSSPP